VGLLIFIANILDALVNKLLLLSIRDFVACILLIFQATLVYLALWKLQFEFGCCLVAIDFILANLLPSRSVRECKGWFCHLRGIWQVRYHRNVLAHACVGGKNTEIGARSSCCVWKSGQGAWHDKEENSSHQSHQTPSPCECTASPPSTPDPARFPSAFCKTSSLYLLTYIFARTKLMSCWAEDLRIKSTMFTDSFLRRFRLPVLHVESMLNQCTGSKDDFFYAITPVMVPSILTPWPNSIALS